MADCLCACNSTPSRDAHGVDVVHACIDARQEPHNNARHNGILIDADKCESNRWAMQGRMCDEAVTI